MGKIVGTLMVVFIGAVTAAAIKSWHENRRTAKAREEDDFHRWEADGGQDPALK